MKTEKEFNRLTPWEIVSEHDEINNRWLRIRNVTFLLPNGQEIRDYFIAEKPSVIVVVPFNKEGKTFLIEEYERGVAEVGHKFPAGRVNQNESSSQAAGREFQEETGLRIGKLIYLGERYVEPGFMATRAHYFLGLDLRETPGGKVENPFELFEGEWVDFKNIGEMIGSGEIKNPFVIVGYTLASMKLRELELI
jgi:8-oxo-dGTP pyrophosphatase MutT (NUDIX family)